MTLDGSAGDANRTFGSGVITELRGVTELDAGDIWIQASGYRHVHLGPDPLRDKTDFEIPLTPGWPCEVSVFESYGEEPRSYRSVPDVEVLCDGESVGAIPTQGFLMFSLDAAPKQIILPTEVLANWKVVERYGLSESGEVTTSRQRSSHVGFVLERR
ncbi:MAG: hypothetical protein ACJA2W_003447 [Planctomycetota bacterium]|jgi:hypothetical protein